MTKKFCDICEREKDAGLINFDEISIKSVEEEIMKLEVCHTCQYKIIDYISSLNPKLAKKAKKPELLFEVLA